MEILFNRRACTCVCDLARRLSTQMCPRKRNSDQSGERILGEWGS